MPENWVTKDKSFHSSESDNRWWTLLPITEFIFLNNVMDVI